MSLSILAYPLGSAANVSPSNETKGTSALTEVIATTAKTITSIGIGGTRPSSTSLCTP